jgi:hypothetical protein
MNSDTGVTKQEAKELLEASQRAVASAKKGKSGGGGAGGDATRQAPMTTVVSGTPTRRVPGLASNKKKKGKLPAAAELM